MVELSFEEFSGGNTSSKQEQSFEQFSEGKPPDPLSPEALRADNLRQTGRQFLFGSSSAAKPEESAFDTTLNSLKAAGGEAAAFVDLLLSAPGFMVNIGGQLGGTVQAAARGVPLSPDQNALNPVTAYSVGREAGHAAGAPFMNPLKRVMDLFKSGEAYEQAKTSQGMAKLTEWMEEAGKWAEEQSGGLVSRDAVPMFAETLMASATGIGSGKAKGIDPVIQKRMREAQKKIREQGELDAQTNTLTPEEFAARAPVQDQINSLLGIRTPAEQAKVTRQRRADVKSAFREPAEGSDFGTIDESIFKANERLDNEAAQASRPKGSEGWREVGPDEVLEPGQEVRMDMQSGKNYVREKGAVADIDALRNQSAESRDTRVTDSEILRIMQKPGFERTAEELITLREARKQEGSALPKGTATLAAAGVTGLLAMDDDLRSVAAGVAEQLALPAAGLTAMFLPVMKGAPNLKKAEAMKAEGKSRTEIWKETGTFQGKDGVWRHELSDSPATLAEGLNKNQFDPSLLAPLKLGESRKLGDLLKHPELYRNFPELKNARVRGVPESMSIRGGFNEATKDFYLGSDTPEQLRETLLHEVQHYIQSQSGMARGGHPSQFVLPEVTQMRQELNVAWKEATRKEPELAEVNPYIVEDALNKQRDGKELYAYEKEELSKVENLQDSNRIAQLILRRRALDKLETYAHKQYMRLAGEVEARSTTKRSTMDSKQRQATPPWESFDLPEDAFLVRMQVGGGKQGLQAAVKGPGGMWHPETVERLASPLFNTLVPDARGPGYETLRMVEREGRGAEGMEREAARDKPSFDWVNKAIRNYLNRYAGTEKDPLKDVEIPSGTGTETWGTLLDRLIDKTPLKDNAGALGDMPVEVIGRLLREKPDEMVFGLNHARQITEADFTSYLSHVGDYLRQNVKPEELPRYDLVRAVKETATNDARVAKQMEKAQADSTKTLPVHKAYPDGFKWVELKLPEKLTAEQAKQVRPSSMREKRELSSQLEREGEMSLPETDDAPWIAVGSDGKPMKNTYTGEIAAGASPEEAWLAGRLAEEGNQMGHCVGGYCPSVASGESKIFSLRDPKGKSHVTVEVAPPDVRAQHNSPEHFARVMGGEWLRKWNEAVGLSKKTGDKPGAAPFDGYKKEVAINREIATSPEYRQWLKEQPSDIQQIKGKQNRAPNKEYLPYVQDFVKEGKWGEVRDLGNTGLVELSRSIQEKYSAPRYVTREESAQLDQKMDGFRSGQEGRVSQEMVVGLAGLGLGGLVGWAMSDDPSGALLGALAGGSLALPGARARLKAAAEIADYGLGAISTRIGNISEPLKLRAREYERKVLTRSHAELTKVAPFMQELQKLPASKRAELDKAILTNDPQAIADLMKGNVPLVTAWRATKNVLNDLGQELQGHGRFRTMLADYFPRLVKDVEGLKNALGQAERTRLEQALLDAEKAAIKNRGTPLTDVEKSSIINREVQGFRRASGYQPGFAKQRGVKDITDTLRPFYHTPAESLYAYVRGAVQDLEMARFFGKDLVQTQKGSQTFINLDGSIGNLVGRELAAGKINHKQAQELIKMLQSRFQGGERSPNKLVQEARNLGNLGLLGNIVSAATQLADTALAIYAQDFRSTITAVARQISGNEKITTKDFGLADHIAEEFVSQTKTANWLNKVFKYSGFSAVDRFGKNTHLNAALARTERLSRTPEGVKKLEAQYGKAFGNEFPALVQDLKGGHLTERVRAMLFSELSDMQPISKMEMPEAYLNNPNGRLIYMLKTFMLKQMDIVRRDSFNEIKQGNVAKGIKNLTEYVIVLGLAGATTDMLKDWIMGKEVHFEAGDVLENALKTFGWSEYTRAKAAQGKPVEAAVGAMAPPYRMMDDLIRRDPRAVQYIPVIGKLYYYWELGGKERAEISRAKKTGADLSEEAKAYRREQRDRARAGKEQ